MEECDASYLWPYVFYVLTVFCIATKALIFRTQKSFRFDTERFIKFRPAGVDLDRPGNMIPYRHRVTYRNPTKCRSEHSSSHDIIGTLFQNIMYPDNDVHSYGSALCFISLTKYVLCTDGVLHRQKCVVLRHQTSLHFVPQVRSRSPSAHDNISSSRVTKFRNTSADLNRPHIMITHRHHSLLNYVPPVLM